MDFTVTHVTRFEYLAPVHESVTEVRLEPRADARQEVHAFELETSPRAAVFDYSDSFGNRVHHFDIVAAHAALVLTTRARVRTSTAPAPPERLDRPAWATLRALRASGELWDFFQPSGRVPVSPLVRTFGEAIGVDAHTDPLTCWHGISAAVHRALAYVPGSTAVDTGVDTVLETRRGVCQDFAHVALALARGCGIPCRYVSGYLAPYGEASADRPLTTHAWIEAWLPGLEWTALDPTHDVIPDERYIAVAVGRDYGDAAPTRGIFRGGPAGALSTSVRIEYADGTAEGSDARTPLPDVVPAPAPAAAHRQQ